MNGANQRRRQQLQHILIYFSLYTYTRETFPDTKCDCWCVCTCSCLLNTACEFSAPNYSLYRKCRVCNCVTSHARCRHAVRTVPSFVKCKWNRAISLPHICIYIYTYICRLYGEADWLCGTFTEEDCSRTRSELTSFTAQPLCTPYNAFPGTSHCRLCHFSTIGTFEFISRLKNILSKWHP